VSIKADVFANSHRTGALGAVAAFFLTPGVQAMFLFRVSQYFNEARHILAVRTTSLGQVDRGAMLCTPTL
jgi:hypothetical protein